MGRTEEADNLADDLESLQVGSLSEHQFRAKHQTDSSPGILSVAWPNIEHYLADFDIRERDSDYRAMQDAAMKRLVRLLRAGAADHELAKVTFLRSG